MFHFDEVILDTKNRNIYHIYFEIKFIRQFTLRMKKELFHYYS